MDRPRYIPPEEIERIKKQADLPRLMRESGVEFSGTETRKTCVCPFCSLGSKKKKMVVSVYQGAWSYACFKCGARGNAFKWIMETEGADFLTAATRLRDSLS